MPGLHFENTSSPTPSVDMSEDAGTSAFILVASCFSMLFALYQFAQVKKISLMQESRDMDGLLTNQSRTTERLLEIYNAIQAGAKAFLHAEYKVCAIFIVLFGAVLFMATSHTSPVSGKGKWDFATGGLTTVAFVVGAITSMISGYLGMMVAVFSNARTTVSAMGKDPWKNSFNTAFTAGSVMGFALCGLAPLMLFFIIILFEKQFSFADHASRGRLFDCVAGFGLGGSCIAMFGRVGGGIYTKAADVGADLAGKVVENIPEDDPRNPATIADNVGDNVGDVAGMGSDLFGSYAEATCAALVVLTTVRFGGDNETDATDASWRQAMFPLLVSCVGVLVCAPCSFIATHIQPVRKEKDVEKVLKIQLLSTTVFITIAVYFISSWSLGEDYYVPTTTGTDEKPVFIHGSPIKAAACVWAGLWAGCMIGFITEYYTSHSYKPTREVAQSCETGAATNIIYGLALGYKSAVIPVVLISAVVFISFTSLDMFGVALAALGMLANLSTCLSIDVYGPICDNAGGIAEMSELPEEVREKTDALDAAGNTTAAIGKGFAIGSACLVGLALFGAFIKRAHKTADDVSLLTPVVFTFLLVGAMIPYWFTALTMKSVGMAANEMVKEVDRQFRTIPGLLEGLEGHAPPDHARCIEISTNASLREMVLPGVMIISFPLVTGTFFGITALAGLLSGAIASAIQMAISSSNTGGAWDNAKKYVERGGVSVKGQVQGKYTDVHKAAVVGDTVGDPLKDTSGPALNIVMKLMAIIALVFADFFGTVANGDGLIYQHLKPAGL